MVAPRVDLKVYCLVEQMVGLSVVPKGKLEAVRKAARMARMQVALMAA